MIAMSYQITLKGQIKFSMKKLLVGGEMAHSTFTGPGELLLAPSALGDISHIQLTGREQWSVGKDAFIAATQGVVKEYKSQGIGKAMFSGEGLFVYKISGQGILWMGSFGAVIRKDVGSTFWAANHSAMCTKIFIQLYSFTRARDISSITAILLLGTANTYLSASLAGALSPGCPPAKAWCVNSQVNAF
jgi:Mitochondrial biogenesis AIM24